MDEHGAASLTTVLLGNRQEAQNFQDLDWCCSRQVFAQGSQHAGPVRKELEIVGLSQTVGIFGNRNVAGVCAPLFRG